MKKVKGFLLDPYKKIAAPIEIEDSLEAYYALLDCSCIDIVFRTIGSKAYAIVCDDEALLRGRNRPAALSAGRTTMLVGAIFVARDDGENLKSITPQDVKFLRNHIGFLHTETEIFPVLTHMGY